LAAIWRRRYAAMLCLDAALKAHLNQLQGSRARDRCFKVGQPVN
jgi:hypothetical protein